ncbi:hypothetical protein V8C86DRAFT_2450883 [Haematococcus lacustris]
MSSLMLRSTGAESLVRPSSGRGASRPSLLVCATGPRVTREYREDDDTVSTPPATPPSTSAQGAMYADEPPKAVPRKSNLSKEMKAKLRKEYVGMGGAENTAMPNNNFLLVIIVVSVLAVASKLIGAI